MDAICLHLFFCSPITNIEPLQGVCIFWKTAMKRSFIWVILHTSAIFCLLLSALTGFRIATVSHPKWLFFSVLLPQGNMHQTHIYSGLVFSTLIISFIIYVLIDRHFFIKENRISRGFNQFVIRLSYLLFPALILTGWLMLFDNAGSITWLHFYLANGALIYFVLHVGGYFFQHGLSAFKTIFMAPLNMGTLFKALCILAVAAMPSVALFKSFEPMLNVKMLPSDEMIEIDGVANEPVWQSAETFMVDTYGGEGFVDGHTQVRLQALHNDNEIFFHIVWDDPTQSLDHLPLVKTEQGWKVQEDGFYRFDEKQFYEDKLAVMLSKTCQAGADGTAHLGHKPLKDKPANWHGKGYHYSSDDQVRDMWHWKAVRTNGMFQADDNVFTRPAKALPGKRRYTAGYITDGKESGSYVMNWNWYTPNGVTPKRLPLDAGASPVPSSPIDLATSKGDFLTWFDTEPYKPNKDMYPVGTSMPSVLYKSHQFEGDRGDVRAFGVWRDGKWSLELVRKLDTESREDVAIDSGVCMWVSAFDHSQISHTRHNQGIRLQLEAGQ